VRPARLKLVDRVTTVGLLFEVPSSMRTVDASS